MAETQGEVPTAAAPPQGETTGQTQSAGKQLQEEQARRFRQQQAESLSPEEAAAIGAREGPGPTIHGREGKNFPVTTPEFQQVLTKKIDRADVLYRELIEKHNDARRRLEQELRDLDPASPEALAKQAQIKALQSELEALVDSQVAPYMGRRIEAGPAEKARLIGIEDLVKKKAAAPEGEKPAIRKEIQVKIRELMKVMTDPEDEPVADDVLKAIAYDEVTAEEFLSRLIVFDLEDQPHTIRGFYGQINFQKFQRLSRDILDPETAQRLRDLIEANASFHNMNYIIRRNFEQFSQQSEALLPQHFKVLAQIPGVDTVIRLYEELHQKELAKDTRLSEEQFRQIDLKVEEAFRELVARQEFVEGKYEGDMLPWEITRAFIYGRNFFRVLVRAAEHTALSNLPERDDPSIFVSSPQKQFTQILNNLKFIGFRFKPNEQLGGPELLEKALKYKTEGRRKKGEVRIKMLQGTDVDMREFQSIIAARGVMATWRNAETALRQIKFLDRDGKPTDIVQFFLDHRGEIEALTDLPEKDDKDKERRKAEVRRVFAPLLENTSIALGILVSPSFMKASAELRELVWEKIAELNPLVMAYILGRLEVDREAKVEKDKKLIDENGKQTVRALEDILVEVWGTPEQKKALEGGQARELRQTLQELEDKLQRLTAKAKDKRSPEEQKSIDDLRKVIDVKRMEYGRLDVLIKELFESKGWLALSGKLRTVNELRIKGETKRLKEGRLGEAPKTLGDYLKEEFGLKLDPEEKEVLEAIKESGKMIAPDLARINQSYSWLLNDTPFADLDWMRLGQFYDRQTGDLGNFNKSAQAINKIVGNPFGQPTDEILKDFGEAVDGAAQVLGLKPAQDNMLPFFKTWLSMVQKKPEWWNRQVMFSAVREFFRRPMSRAQEIVGMDAPALDEDGTLEVLDKSIPKEIIRREVKGEFGEAKWDSTYDKLVNEFHAAWFHRLLGKVRDWGPFGIIAFLIALFKTTTKGKA